MKNKTAIGLLLSAIVVTLLSFPGIVSAQQVVVITNPNTPASSLSKDDLKSIFLAQKTKWDDGQKIICVTLKRGRIHDDFLKNYLGKSPSQFQRYFRTLVYTGRGSAPKSFDSEEALVAFVEGTDGAIGYVSSGTTTGSAKVLSINEGGY